MGLSTATTASDMVPVPVKGKPNLASTIIPVQDSRAIPVHSDKATRDAACEVLLQAGWQLPEELLASIVADILESRLMVPHLTTDGPQHVSSVVNDVWRNGMPIVLEMYHREPTKGDTTLFEQWMISLDWAVKGDTSGVHGLAALVEELQQHLVSFPLMATDRSFSIGASASPRFPYSNDTHIRERNFPPVRTPMGVLRILVRHDANTLAKRPPPRRTLSAPLSPVPPPWSTESRIAGMMGRRPGRSRSLTGTLEESMLSGRMSAFPNRTLDGFVARLGVATAGKCPPTVSVPFCATFYQLADHSASPYSGVVNLCNRMQPTGRPHLYKVPKCGSLNVAIVNPNQSLLRVYVVKYDLNDMPPRHRTFVRQRYVSCTGDSRVVRHSVHVQFASSRRGSVYVHGEVRVLFTPRNDDTVLNVECLQPDNPRYTPLPVSVDC